LQTFAKKSLIVCVAGTRTAHISLAWFGLKQAVLRPSGHGPRQRRGSKAENRAKASTLGVASVPAQDKPRQATIYAIMQNVQKQLLNIYGGLYKHFGPQRWWPADSAFEVAVGAILTQNTLWANVERAIANLKKERFLTFQKMLRLDEKKLARLIRPAGYYNIKAKRLKNFLDFFNKNYGGSFKRMKRKSVARLRRELLSVNGIGPETADSILLYALGKPVFVVDAYTRRIMSRHRLLGARDGYEAIQSLFMDSLPTNTGLFNEYHALLVKCAKELCKKKKENCKACPLNEATTYARNVNI
jgi:endonuclease-3 related protein